MDLLDRLVRHDAWTTQRLLALSGELTNAQLDQDFGIGHRTVRATLHHIVSNMETWSGLMAGDQAWLSSLGQDRDRSISGLTSRLDEAARRLADVAYSVRDRNAWDEEWLDWLDEPPKKKTCGAAIAHVLTHGMHHRAQLLYMLKTLGITPLPEGDVMSWERQLSNPESRS